MLALTFCSNREEMFPLLGSRKQTEELILCQILPDFFCQLQHGCPAEIWTEPQELCRKPILPVSTQRGSKTHHTLL